jgi:hypothetical protein
MLRDRPTFSTDPSTSRGSQRDIPLSNYEPTSALKETAINDAGVLLGSLDRPVGGNILWTARNKSQGGLRPGSTSVGGGTIPYHTSGRWTDSNMLQNQAKPSFKNI